MPKQKIYVLIHKGTQTLMVSAVTSQLLIYAIKSAAMKESKRCVGSEVVTIPADSLHKLILLHTKQKS